VELVQVFGGAIQGSSAGEKMGKSVIELKNQQP
jgi:hypothetical protein